MNSTCDEFLAGARLAKNQDGGVGRGDGLDLLQDPAESGAFADDLSEVVLGANLLLQVDFLLLQLVFQRLDLIEGQGVLHGHGHLVGDLLQEVHIRRVIGTGLLAPEPQHAQATVRRREGKSTGAVHPIRLRPL